MQESLTTSVGVRPWGRRDVLVAAAATVAVASMSLTQTLAVPLMPHLVDRWGVDRASVSWVATATLIASAVVNPIVGRLGDLSAKRPLLLGSLSVTIVGSLIGMTAGSLSVVIVARLLQGCGAGIIPLGLAVVRQEVRPERVARATAFVMVGGAGIGAGLGPVLSGLALDVGGLRTGFALTLGAAALAGCLMAVALPVEPAPRGPLRRFDVAGSIGSAVVLVCLLVPVTKGSAWGWSSPGVVGLLATGVLGALAWVAWERRQPDPLVDFAVSRRPAVALAHLGGIVVGFSTFALYITVVTLVSMPATTPNGLGRSLFVAGLVQVPGALALSGAIVGLSSRAGSVWPLPRVLCGGAVVVGAGFALAAACHGSLGAVAATTVVVSLGMGALFVSTPLLVLRGVAPDETAATSAVNALARLSGSVSASAVVSAVLAASTVAVGAGRYPTESAFVRANALAAGVALVMVPIAVAVGRRR
jgi:MFS family permease